MISKRSLEQAIYPYATLLMHAIAHFSLIDGRVKLSFSWSDVSSRKKVASAPLKPPTPRVDGEKVWVRAGGKGWAMNAAEGKCVGAIGERTGVRQWDTSK